MSVSLSVCVDRSETPEAAVSDAGEVGEEREEETEEERLLGEFARRRQLRRTNDEEEEDKEARQTAGVCWSVCACGGVRVCVCGGV